MKKAKGFVSFFVILAMICLTLSGCSGSGTSPAANEESDSDVVQTGGGENNEPSTIITEGGYEHKIGNAVFYTDNDLNRWIDGGVFDFYGMMDYLGWVIEPAVQEENGYWVIPGSDIELYDTMVRLNDSGVTDRYDVINGGVGSTNAFWIEMTESEGKILKTPNGRDISYELCEILLYTMECIGKDGEYINADLANLAKYLPSRVFITTRNN